MWNRLFPEGDAWEPQMRSICSICRCSSPAEHSRRAEESARESDRYATERAEKLAKEQAAAAKKRYDELAAMKPDPDNYQIERYERVGNHIVMQARYTNCKKCTFEGLKTMVFLDVPEHAAVKWRRIDPHFRVRTTDHFTAHPHDAPSPAARFPGDPSGWQDALDYAKAK